MWFGDRCGIFGTILTIVHLASTQDVAAPKFANPVGVSYTNSSDPATDSGYSNPSERPGGYWSFETTAAQPQTNDTSSENITFIASKSSSSPRPASRTPPPAISSGNVLLADGIRRAPELTAGGDPNDESIRMTGEDGCVVINDLSTEDQCLTNPSSCHLVADGVRGLSISFWLNLPNNFDTTTRYILDTGGNEYGRPGVAIFYSNSQTGVDFNQQLTVVVSTGSSYWKTAINGMLRPYRWSNLAVRWSPDKEPSTNITYGLQIFVNGTSTAWKRYPFPATSSSVYGQDHNISDHWSLGCRSKGGYSMAGRLDEFAVWYWRLGDDQLPLFAGGMNFDRSNYGTSSAGPCQDVQCLPGPTVGAPPGWHEKQQQTKPHPQDVMDPEVFAAVEGDCIASDPNTYAGKHPIYCADTYKELRDSVSYSPDYDALALLQALIRVLVRIHDPLAQSDIDDLLSIFYREGLPRMQKVADIGDNATSYLDVVQVISKLTEIDPYLPIWRNEEVIERKPGITEWDQTFDVWVENVAGLIETPTSDYYPVFSAANHSALAIFKMDPTKVNADLIYPNYSSPDFHEAFWENRSSTWTDIGDTIFLSKSLLFDTENVSTTVILKYHNSLGQCMPAFLDSRIENLGETEFFVNSRVMSFSMIPSDISSLQKFPVTITLKHLTPQYDRPYKKAAILCVHWLQNDDANSIGAWDTNGCRLYSTNDTHSTCQCSVMSNYAILMENYQPKDAVSARWYNALPALYTISAFCLLVFIMNAIIRPELHYEMHMIHNNLAFALMIAIVLFNAACQAQYAQLSCTIVSAFMHYAYLSTYVWFALSAHYICRAIITGRLGRVIFWYNLIGWGVPAVVVGACVSQNVLMYGYGSRCLGSPYKGFMSVYVGTILAACAAALPMYILALLNVCGKRWRQRNPEDWSDIKMTMLGHMLIWPLLTGTWVMALLVYVIPQPYESFDYLFDLLNSLQGIAVLVFLGFFTDSFRKAFFCKRQHHAITNEQWPLSDNESGITIILLNVLTLILIFSYWCCGNKACPSGC